MKAGGYTPIDTTPVRGGYDIAAAQRENAEARKRRVRTKTT